MSTEKSNKGHTSLSQRLFRRLYTHALWRSSQISQMPRRLGNYIFGTIYNDIFLSRKIRLTNGQESSSERFAIYTIFPITGLRPSHYDALRAISEAGYKTIIVSNLPLTDDDRQRLSLLSWMIVERPNFGYDFGAYRQGILTIKKKIEGPLSELVLLNDSVWFPVGTANWLQAVQDIPASFVGAVPNCCVELTQGELTDPVDWRYDHQLNNFHYCSFALRFDHKILNDPRFWSFWGRFRLTDDKVTTIHRGEVGLSRWLLSKGYSHASTFPLAALDSILNNKTTNDLLKISKGLVIPEDIELNFAKNAITSMIESDPLVPDNLRNTALRNLILRVVAKTGAAYAIPELAIDELGYCFLKKSPLRLNEEGQQITREILKRHCKPSYLEEADSIADR